MDSGADASKRSGACKIDFTCIVPPSKTHPVVVDLGRGFNDCRVHVHYVRGEATLRWLLALLGELIKCSYPLDIYSNNDSLCVFLQDRALGGDA